MLYTAAPRIWPTGSKPTLRIEVNSSVDKAEPHVPLRRISAIRASAVDGSPDRRGSSVTAHLSRGSPHDTLPPASEGRLTPRRRRRGRPTPGSAPAPVPGRGWLPHGWHTARGGPCPHSRRRLRLGGA